MTCNTLGLVTQNDCKVYWPTRIKSELWHSRSMGIWAHPTYSICLLAIILLRISCLFSYYFWVISIPISVGFFSLPGMSFLFIHPSCPLSLKDVTHFYISYRTSYDNFSLQWFLHFVFLFHLIQHLFLWCDFSYPLHGAAPSHNTQFIWCFVLIFLIGRHQMRNCGFMGFFFFMFVILSTDCQKALIVVNKVPRRRLPNRAAEGIWNHPDCLHQFQGKLSRGK